MRIGGFMYSYAVPFPLFSVFFGQVGGRIGGLVNINIGTSD